MGQDSVSLESVWSPVVGEVSRLFSPYSHSKVKPVGNLRRYEEPSSSRQKNCNQEQQTLEVRHRLDIQGVPSDDRGRHSHVSALNVSGSPGRRCAAVEDSGSDDSEGHGSVLEARGRGSLESHDWKLEPDLKLAAYKFQRNLQEAEEQPELAGLAHFQSSSGSALGDGVACHFRTSVMSGVQSGFDLNLDHLVPSTSRILLDSDLFRAVGRMIGRSFIHGGPLLTGLSRSAFRLMTGEKNEPAIVGLDDCPDTDIVEIVSLIQGPGKLTEAERRQVQEVGISWDLPSVTEENRQWLAQCRPQHAVAGRREKHMQQIKKGLKDTGVLSMIKERSSLMEQLFPRAASQIILDKTIWPAPDTEEDMDYQLEDSCKVTGFLCQYIEHGRYVTGMEETGPGLGGLDLTSAASPCGRFKKCPNADCVYM
ncbi:hypothetical protein AOLI_G00271560 [Acnodon oligacanthus]